MAKTLVRHRRFAILKVELCEFDIQRLPDNSNLHSLGSQRRIQQSILEDDFEVIALTPLETKIGEGKWVSSYDVTLEG